MRFEEIAQKENKRIQSDEGEGKGRLSLSFPSWNLWCVCFGWELRHSLTKKDQTVSFRDGTELCFVFWYLSKVLLRQLRRRSQSKARNPHEEKIVCRLFIYGEGIIQLPVTRCARFIDTCSPRQLKLKEIRAGCCSESCLIESNARGLRWDSWKESESFKIQAYQSELLRHLVFVFGFTFCEFGALARVECVWIFVFHHQSNKKRILVAEFGALEPSQLLKQ